MGVPVLAQAPLTGASAHDALAYADTLAHASSRALDDALAAAILHGSLTLGDYLPGRSDIDLLLIVNDPLTDAHLADLAKAVGQQRPRGPVRVDLRVVTRTAAGAPSSLPPMEAFLRIKGPERRVHLEGRDRGERDLAVSSRFVARTGAASLARRLGISSVESQTHGCLTRAMPSWPTGKRSATTRHTPSWPC